MGPSHRPADLPPHLHTQGHPRLPSRRDVLRGLSAAGLAGMSGLAGAVPARAGSDPGPHPERILVVVELSGANDGLNTLVPYADDAYYRLRPRIGIRPGAVRRIDDHYGFNPGMAGFERLYKDGRLAIVHGCGYADPSFSHFTSAAYWHTGAPHRGEPYGWLGRLADAADPGNAPDFIVNIAEQQSLAVRARRHVPVVFDDPETFRRKGLAQARPILDDALPPAAGNPEAQYLAQIARAAQQASLQVPQAWHAYRSPVRYGIIDLDLPKVAALVQARLGTRIFHVGYRHNAFDTHVQQAETHQRLLTYTADSVAGFLDDMERLGRADDVLVLVYSEFGRRAAENTSLGTDHGTANHMYLAGRRVRGGHHGRAPSLTDLDETQNLKFSTDFRQVYASVAESWFSVDSRALLGGDFPRLDLVAA